jgi:hypothetical protein
MKRIVATTDLQRAATGYAPLEEDPERVDELELLEMVEQARAARDAGETITHAEVKRRLAKGNAERPARVRARERKK